MNDSMTYSMLVTYSNTLPNASAFVNDLVKLIQWLTHNDNHLLPPTGIIMQHSERVTENGKH